MLSVLALALLGGRPAPSPVSPCAGPTTLDLLTCASQQYRQADAHLNAAYTSLLAELRASGKTAAVQRLVRAQRAWVVFKESECAFQASAYLGGSLEEPTRLLCLARLTRQRATELGAFGRERPEP